LPARNYSRLVDYRLDTDGAYQDDDAFRELTQYGSRAKADGLGKSSGVPVLFRNVTKEGRLPGRGPGHIVDVFCTWRRTISCLPIIALRENRFGSTMKSGLRMKEKA